MISLIQTFSYPTRLNMSHTLRLGDMTMLGILPCMNHRVLITGASGYVGAMLVREFAQRDDVEAIFGIDKEPISDLYASNEKVTFVQANISDESWLTQARSFQPDVVIHTAWQIREMYGDQKTQWKWNIGGSDNVFDLAFSCSSVRRLVHFSTVASYGAFADNSIDHFYTEDEPFRHSEYLYAEEKLVAEEHLHEKYMHAQKKGSTPQVAIVRPSAITGPRGRIDRVRFGLQAALSGTLKGKGSILYDLISLMVSWVPVTPKWLRQYVHEDDVTDSITLLAFGDYSGQYEAFNLAPPGHAVFGADMAKAVGKRALLIYPWMVRVPFFFLWHVSRGRVPTSRGSWRGYSYPIAVDGSKITRMCGYRYHWQSKDAFTKNEGRYARSR